MSAVIPAPDEGSKPAMVSTTGGFSAMVTKERSTFPYNLLPKTLTINNLERILRK
jgi:hypothetical protein